MFNKVCASVIIFLAVFCLAGCKKDLTYSVCVGEYVVRIDDLKGSTGVELNKQGCYYFEADKSLIMICDNVMYVNYKDYGEISPSNDIYISGSDITIDGLPRIGSETDREKMMFLTPYRRVKSNLGRHQVIIEPGYGLVEIKKGLFGAEELSTGDLTVSLRRSMLFVNGKKVGNVGGGAIHIRWGEVISLHGEENNSGDEGRSP